jgi:hypothetical protein
MAADQDAKKKDAKPKGKGKDEPEPDLSEEDQELKKNLELMVERVSDPDAGVQKLALQSITKEIKTATSSMTSVPKPLKFLRAHTEALKAGFEKLTNAENRSLLADIISVMATTTASKEGVRDALKYKLLGSQDDLGVWGHEYLRHLAGEISEEFSARQEAGAAADDLMALVQQIVPFHMTHNAEPEAVDLLLEVERLDLLAQHVDEKNYGRTCLYLVSCCHYLPEPEDTSVLECAHAIYLKLAKWHDAMRIALHLNRRETIEATFAACPDLLAKKQLCYLLARQGVPLDLEDGPCAVEDDGAREALREIISNSKLSEHYLTLARDLDVMEPKLPEDVYKSHLTEGRAPQGAAVDSARQNLASSFVNAFVNAGFGHDKLVTASSEGAGDGQVRVRARAPALLRPGPGLGLAWAGAAAGRPQPGPAAAAAGEGSLGLHPRQPALAPLRLPNLTTHTPPPPLNLTTHLPAHLPTCRPAAQVHWIFKNKDHGKTSATASLGMVTLWDVEGGLPLIDKYLYSTDNYVVAGALLAIGIVNSTVQNENDPAFALICDYVGNSDQTVRIGAILGLGLAYAGGWRALRAHTHGLPCSLAPCCAAAGLAAAPGRLRRPHLWALAHTWSPPAYTLPRRPHLTPPPPPHPPPLPQARAARR